MISRMSRALCLLIVFAFAPVVVASSLSISAVHDVVVTAGDKQELVRVSFSDQPLAADIKLNVYVLPSMPSSREHYAELRSLNKDSWMSEVEWKLTSQDGPGIALPFPHVLSG